MRHGLAFLMTVAIMVFTSFAAETHGGDKPHQNDADAVRGSAGNQTGVRTDRLSPRQLQNWKKIQGIVSARDAAGRLLHPTLGGLWQEVESSGHTIFIDMREISGQNMAGRFIIERIDPEGKNHILSIQLCISTIDRVNTSQTTRRADGFTPFEKLDPKKRYAEVLGHELAHAVLTLKNPDYRALKGEQDRLVAELELRLRHERKMVLDLDNLQRARRLDFLAEQVEAPANAAEIEIWRELAQNHGKNAEIHKIKSLAVLQSAR